MDDQFGFNFGERVARGMGPARGAKVDKTIQRQNAVDSLPENNVAYDSTS